MSRDKFGSMLKTGRSLTVLATAKKYFQSKHTVSVLSYDYTRDCYERPKRFLTRSDLKKCCVCGRNLYSLLDKMTDSASDELETYIRQKQYMRFLDSNGKYWTTCYKLNQCYSAIDYDPSWSAEGQFRVPTFEEFANLSGTLPPELDVEVRATYSRVVLPFLIEWGTKEITKDNVMTFMKALRDTELVWLVYFSDDPATQSRAAGNLLTQIGVKR